MKPFSPTPRMIEAARVVHRFSRANGISPTVLEVATEMGISRTAADELVKGACARGLMERRERSARSLRASATCFPRARALPK